jgi:hypothetical protein
VARSDVVPHDFEHPSLFQPKEKPADTPSADLGIDGLRATLASASGARVRPLQLAQATVTGGEGGKVTDAVTDPAVVPRGDANVEVPAPPTLLPIETPTDADTTATIKAGEKTPEAATPPALAATPKPADPGKPLELRLSGSEPDKPAGDVVDPPKPQVPKTKAATEQPIKRGGHVAVFVSRKEKKLFVRQGFVPLFDMPIEIDNPDQPLGTHVFSALALRDDGVTMRWNVMSMPGDPSRTSERERDRDRRKGRKAEPVKPVVDTRPLPTAVQALERIHLPKEAVDRIDEILVPGSSLVISDQGLGGETGRGTDFIVLTR